MRIVAVGGGSGGHVTPVRAVINELKKHDSKLEVFFVTDRAFGAQATAIMKESDVKVRVKKITAGKFRRYHNVKWWRQAFDFRMHLLNLRDMFFVVYGTLQSLWLLKRFKPDAVFTKGGFVCVPVGIAARWLKIPLLIHDSDARPGLANKILAKWAAVIATGSPLENYKYPKSRSHYVGIPVGTEFKPLSSSKEQQKLKSSLGLPDVKKPLVVVTGGGLGARNLNRALGVIAPKMLQKTSFYHITGENLFEEAQAQVPQAADYITVPFISSGMAAVLGSADVVITRAGATTLQELAGMKKAIIIIPHPNLHDQQKNSEVYKKAKAALVLDESRVTVNPLILSKAIGALLDHPKERQAMAERLHDFSRPDAAVDMAALIAEVVSAHKQQKAAN